MTSDNRSQEAEDVAREINNTLEHFHEEVSRGLRQWDDEANWNRLARLVREGQIKVLLLAAADQCFACGGKWDEFVAEPVLGRWWSTRWEHPMRGREEAHGAQCLAPRLRARIAALKQEG